MTSRGLFDTSVLIDWPDEQPVEEVAISALSLAELAAGPLAARSASERAIRQARLQWAEGTFDALPFDTEAARAYGQVYSAVRAARRTSPRRLADLLIASVAVAHGLPLYTRNPDDFRGLSGLLEVVAV